MDKPSPELLKEEIKRVLDSEQNSEKYAEVLELVLDYFNCAVGTIHYMDQSTNLLRLMAQVGIPDSIKTQVSSIPVGKGMAGIAAERREPVQVCNLQTDNSGVAKQGAKETRMEGSIAVPMLTGDDIKGVLGVAKPTAYEFSPDEISTLQEIATLLGSHLKREEQ
jgi:L-methionine (R)-S-oxide reductase